MGGDVIARKSLVQSTGPTWNPVTGDDRISAGCHHGYALPLAGDPDPQRVDG